MCEYVCVDFGTHFEADSMLDTHTVSSEVVCSNFCLLPLCW